ncbi:hypothetical protein IAE33_000239 [Pseudomonas sp. S60]|uniref:hypothetical protein n=1 Tax=Pseudomonas sp. S60 TaxID=211124 RepID=UPI00191333AC|nr:hypothetical protein [Pseudomonas sp. S60]MBK5008379.1 hypothetical protein [Pseudomonas sp. S60]
MAYDSAHTGPEIDATVQMLGQVQDARDATKSDLAEVKSLAAKVDANTSQVQAQADTVAIKAEQVATSAQTIEQARTDVAAASASAEEAMDAASQAAMQAGASQKAATASQQAAASSEIAAGLSEQVSAENVASTQSVLVQVNQAAQKVTADYSSIAALIKPSPSVQISHEFLDANRFMIGGLRVDGTLLMDGGLEMATGQIKPGADGFEFLDANRFVMGRVNAGEGFLGGLAWRNTPFPGIEIVDQYGFVLQSFDNTPPLAAGGSLTPPPFPMLNCQLRTQIMLIIGYGQSLSRAVNSVPAISTTQPYSNIMIASGTKIRNGEAGYNAGSFVPLVAKTEGSEGEDPVIALCNGVVRRLVADGEAYADWVFLGTSPGRSARSVEELGPSSDSNAFYNKMVRYVQDAKNLADASGKTFSCWAYCWDQGESNYVGAFTRSPYQYAQLMLALFDTLTRQIVGITGQQFQPYIFSYQVAAHRVYSIDKNTVALAQWRISRERPDFVLAVPVYIIPVVDVDKLHLTNEGSWLLGEYRSRAMYQTMIRRSGKWRPLEPIAVDWQAGYVDVKFHVPSGPLVLDTALCAQTVNMGFDIRENDVVAEIITGVAVTAKDTVRITLSREANTNAVLSYARGRNGDPAASGPVLGARGNLRDSHGLHDTAVSPLGNTFALHNPCVMFQYSRATGF